MIDNLTHFIFYSSAKCYWNVLTLNLFNGIYRIRGCSPAADLHLFPLFRSGWFRYGKSKWEFFRYACLICMTSFLHCLCYLLLYLLKVDKRALNGRRWRWRIKCVGPSSTIKPRHVSCDSQNGAVSRYNCPSAEGHRLQTIASIVCGQCFIWSRVYPPHGLSFTSNCC